MNLLKKIFGATRVVPDGNFIWQDRAIRTDVERKELSLRKGEFEIDSDEELYYEKRQGRLIVTNLRIIWLASGGRSLSIGYDTIRRNPEVKTAGTNLQISIQTEYNRDSEYIFYKMGARTSVFSAIEGVLVRYRITRTFREVSCEGKLSVKHNQVILIPEEQIIHKNQSITANYENRLVQGTLLLTNLRIIWYDSTYNKISIPYLQIQTIRKGKSKRGTALNVTCYSSNPLRRSETPAFLFESTSSSIIDQVLLVVQKETEDNRRNPVFGVEYQANFNLKDHSASFSYRNTKITLRQSVELAKFVRDA